MAGKKVTVGPGFGGGSLSATQGSPGKQGARPKKGTGATSVGPTSGSRGASAGKGSSGMDRTAQYVQGASRVGGKNNVGDTHAERAAMSGGRAAFNAKRASQGHPAPPQGMGSGD